MVRMVRPLAPAADGKNDLLRNKQTIGAHLVSPLVSIVMINRNYGEYIGKAIASIRSQSYAHFECLIVDNASTDDSNAVILAGIAGDARFSTVKLEENLGQLRAVLHVFDRLQGEFVVVVDADDMLFPDFLSFHLQAHLALPAAVGFTSSDIIEIDAEDRVLTGGQFGFADGCEMDPRGLKSPETALRLSAVSRLRLCQVEPRHRHGASLESPVGLGAGHRQHVSQGRHGNGAA